VPRVLTARFMHETNTFSRVKTDMALIRRRDFHLENEIPQALRGPSFCTAIGTQASKPDAPEPLTRNIGAGCFYLGYRPGRGGVFAGPR